uniref:Uncharacterized protein n=1 Tax=Medicago truncatula TaxID=3880 RepID=I3SN02_MEDTR|nr:unknown [Medicago truncatula]
MKLQLTVMMKNFFWNNIILKKSLKT